MLQSKKGKAHLGDEKISDPKNSGGISDKKKKVKKQKRTFFSNPEGGKR